MVERDARTTAVESGTLGELRHVVHKKGREHCQRVPFNSAEGLSTNGHACEQASLVSGFTIMK